MTRFLAPLLIGLIGAAVLGSLGVWQVQRLTWKEGVLADIEARSQGAPVAVPATPDPDADRYLPVEATGTITGDEVHVLVSTRDTGAAFRVIAAFETEEGRRLMLDRGIVRTEAKTAPRPATEATVTGNLHWPDEIDGFTPEPDLAANIWYARDLPALADALDAEPVLIVLRGSSETDPPVTPLPVTATGIPNDHLEYAVTWFGLAAVWVLMTFVWIRRLRRDRN